jgi:protein-S-isoprenylcysteine O-methyltransferase Ste14
MDHLATFFENPARTGLAGIVLVGVGAVVVFRLDVNPLRKGSTPPDSQSLQLGILLLLSLSLLWFLPFADRNRILTLGGEYWRFIGLALCCAGIIVRLLALKALGPYFSAYVTLQPDHRLVRNGIYSLIRHPLYLSLLLLPTGMALVFRSALAFPIVILATIFVSDRIRTEEQLLSARFAEFQDYRRRVWMLVPLVF